jgi:septal ring factor EnvC (AmiA/AmiB activator)
MSDRDPAVRAWGESMAASADQAASTSALLRKLTADLDQLRADYNTILRERNLAWDQLANAQQIILDLRDRSAADVNRAAGYLSALDDMGKDLAAALVENQRLTYHLTDKGRAALAQPEPTEGEPPA